MGFLCRSTTQKDNGRQKRRINHRPTNTIIIFGAEKAEMPHTSILTSGQNKWKKFAIQSNIKSIAAMEAIPLSNKMI